MTKAMEAMVTGTAAQIVTALGNEPCSALDLSQRLPGISYANIRQHLRRMAEAGVVTRLRRGMYGLHCDSAPVAAPAAVTRRIYTDAQIANAIASAWAHFEAMNDISRPEAWA